MLIVVYCRRLSMILHRQGEVARASVTEGEDSDTPDRIKERPSRREAFSPEDDAA